MRAPITLNSVDLNLLRTFDLLMQERSVTAAARRAGRTQSAISHSLGRLRELFRNELFTRQGGAMIPTPQAIELAAVVSRSLSEIQQALDRHSDFKPSQSKRHFRIGVSDYTGAIYLPSLIEEFARAAPLATLTAIPVRSDELAEQLKRPEMDCIIIGNPPLADNQVHETVLARHKMMCATWAQNPLIREMSLESYLAAPHLQISGDGNPVGVSDHALAAIGRVRNVVATIPHYLVASRVLHGTNLITAFADGMLLVIANLEDVRLFAPPFELPDVRLSLIFDRGKQADFGHIWLRNMIKSVSDRIETRRRAAILEFLET